ncbi:MAG TPA: hypothetical protein VGP93_05115 [Polyangiaceae bacterium]|jgi:hypothetical protein|nr:hypothetical protein [Polyangiaceae bacterium]
MSAERREIDANWCAYLHEGGPASEALLAGLERDPALLAELKADQELHSLLLVLGHLQREQDDAFAAELGRRLAATADIERFTAAVAAKLERNQRERARALWGKRLLPWAAMLALFVLIAFVLIREKREVGIGRESASFQVRDLRRIVRFDFENGALPRGFFAGVPETGPGKRRCLRSSGLPQGPLRQAVAHQLTPPANYQTGMLLRFDYWVPRDVELRVTVLDKSQRQWYSKTVRPLVRGAWAHAELRLSEFGAGRGPSPGIREGDRIAIVSVEGGEFEGETHYIDNFELAVEH